MLLTALHDSGTQNQNQSKKNRHEGLTCFKGIPFQMDRGYSPRQPPWASFFTGRRRLRDEFWLALLYGTDMALAVQHCPLLWGLDLAEPGAVWEQPSHETCPKVLCCANAFGEGLAHQQSAKETHRVSFCLLIQGSADLPPSSFFLSPWTTSSSPETPHEIFLLSTCLETKLFKHCFLSKSLETVVVKNIVTLKPILCLHLLC